MILAQEIFHSVKILKKKKKKKKKRKKKERKREWYSYGCEVRHGESF